MTVMRPRVSVFPKCYFDQLCRGEMDYLEWIRSAATLGGEGVEHYDGFFRSLTAADVDPVLEAMADTGQVSSMLCFSPDFKKCYVVDTGATDGPQYPANIIVFDVANNALRNGKVFADFKPGFTDGIRCDTDGNVWCGWGWGGVDTNGVRVHAPSGDLLAFLHTPEVIANLCFGGTKRNRLFMTGSTSIYALYVNAVGAALS